MSPRQEPERLRNDGKPDGRPPLANGQSFRSMVDAAPAILWLTDERHRRTFLSHRWYEYTGQAEAEALGFGWTRAVHPDHRERVVEALRRATERRVPFQLDYRLRRASGEHRWVIDAGRPRFDADGTFLGYSGSVIDVDERKQVEQALRASEERLRLATRAGRVGVWDWDVETDSVTWSDTHYEIHGLEPGTFDGTVDAFADLVHPDDRERVQRAVRRALEEGERYELEFRSLRPDGRTVWIYTQAEVVTDASGKPVRMLGATVDVTERKRAEEALQRRFRQLETIYLLSATVARAADVDEVVDAAMEGLVRAVGADRTAVLLFDEHEVIRFKGWRGLSERYRRAVEGHSPWRPRDAAASPLAIEDVREDESLGDLREVILGEGIRALSFIPLVSGARLLGKFMVYYDAPHPFTEQELQVCQAVAGHVAYAIERARSERALRDSDRRKDEFLATLAHELRNPLAPLRTMLQVMKREADPELLRRARDTMERQVDQMVRLVDDLLDVSRITRGEIRLHPERVDLVALVGDVVEDARPRFDARGQEVTITCPPGPVHVVGDPIRLSQVVENLLSNACKYTGPGGRIGVILERGDGGAVIRVRDTGIGIDGDRLPHIFEMFSHGGDPAGGSAEAGLGIGLALVRDLVELHGGAVEAHSDGRGRGSEFTVRLPVGAEAAAPEPEAPGETGRRPGESAAPRRVLIVDDNRDAAESLAMLLRLSDHEVHIAFDGLEAVEVAAAVEPDVVLLDLGLPELNGYEAARRIRQQDGGRRVLIVALTGWSQEEDRRRSEEAGFDAHLVKPLDPAELDRLLARRR